MHYAGCGVKPSGHGAAELCTVMAARKEVDEPIVDFVRFIRGSHIVEQSGVPNGVKDLLMSSTMTSTYELHDSIFVTDWRMVMRAAVVDPVRWKAY